ncbi:MAG: KTSC domain-containing protein, partial [Chthoniobacterales bacterium]
SRRLQFLDIEFLNGAIYRYVAVPRSINHGLMQADSKAHYFHEHIKGRFKSSRIRRWQTKQTGVPGWIAFDNASF